LYFFWLITVTVFWTIFFGIIIIVVFPFDITRGKILCKIVKSWARFIFLSSGIKTKIIGLENLDYSKNYIFAANHSSSLDIPLMLGFIPFWLVPISKIELKWIPFLGWAMQMAGHVFVDRRNHEKAMSSIKRIKKSLINRPRSILLFPEGSRTSDGKLKRFKSGGLSLGIETKIAIVPVVIIGTYESLKKDSTSFINNLLIVKIGIPIDTKGYNEKDRKILSNLVYDRVKELKNHYL
jgi:1-acyl-sn-glycerol-3-phosphate acyltransferase